MAHFHLRNLFQTLEPCLGKFPCTWSIYDHITLYTFAAAIHPFIAMMKNLNVTGFIDTLDNSIPLTLCKGLICVGVEITLN